MNQTIFKLKKQKKLGNIPEIIYIYIYIWEKFFDRNQTFPLLYYPLA
jgi:hypothetical protein